MSASDDRATLAPKALPDPVIPSRQGYLVRIRAPSGAQVPVERTNANAEPPSGPESCGTPISAVLPSPDSDTLVPNSPDPTSPFPSFAHVPVQSPTSVVCCVQAAWERLNTQALPAEVAPPSNGAPISAVLPSVDSDTL